MFLRSVATAAMMFAASAAAHAEVHEVHMLNRGEAGAMVFEPAFIAAQPGDTIVFIPTDRSHNAETINGMIPGGAEGFKGRLNEEVSVTLEEEGLYGIRCTPHYAMGMVALIQVGEPVNLDEVSAVKHPGRAAATFEALIDQAQG